MRPFGLRFLSLCLFALPTALFAQDDGDVEFGTDFAVTFATSDAFDNVTRLDVPTSLLRVGFHLTDRFVVEPAVALNAATDGDDSATSLQLGVGLLGDLTGNVFVGIDGGLLRSSFETSDGSSGSSSTTTTAFLGGAVGFRKALTDHAGLRWQIGVGHLFEADSDRGHPAQTQYSASMGISFFLGG